MRAPEWLSRHRGLVVAGTAALIVAVAATALAIASPPGGGQPSPPGAGPPVARAPSAVTSRWQEPNDPQQGRPDGGRHHAGHHGADRGDGQQDQPGAPYQQVPPDHVATLPASELPPAPGSGTRRVTLVMLSGTPTLSVRVAPMGGTLVAAATAPGYGARPELAQLNGDGQVVSLTLASAATEGGAGGGGLPGSADASVTLSPDVTWQLDFGGGTGSATVNLAGGRVAGLDFGQGASVISVTLPRPRGTVVIKLDGGASELHVRTPDGVPARVTAGGGASEVQLDGASYSGIADGTVIAQPSWAAAGNRIDVDATSGASLISVTQGASVTTGD